MRKIESWRFRVSTEVPHDCGVIETAAGEVVCDFGNSEEFYPTAGEPPSAFDLSLMLAAPDLLRWVIRLKAACQMIPGYLTAHANNLDEAGPHAGDNVRDVLIALEDALAAAEVVGDADSRKPGN